MPSFEPFHDPRPPVVRRPIRAVRPNPHTDPVVPARRPILTAGNCILAIIMLTFGLYARGNLPQLDQAFNGLHSSLQSRNDAVVKTTLHFGPLLLLGFILLLLLTFSVLRFLVRPPRVSEDMDWHSQAVAAPRPVLSVKAAPRAHGEAVSFIRPLHKQSKLRQIVPAPLATPAHTGYSADNNGPQAAA